MKKFSIAMLLLLVGAALFANGTREPAPAIGPRLERIQPESITANGTLHVTENAVVLTSPTGSYSLSAPGVSWLNIADLDGTAVEVDGILTPCDICDQDYDGHILIDRAVVNGEVYDFSNRGGYAQNGLRQPAPAGAAGRGFSQPLPGYGPEQRALTPGLRQPAPAGAAGRGFSQPLPGYGPEQRALTPGLRRPAPAFVDPLQRGPLMDDRGLI